VEQAHGFDVHKGVERSLTHEALCAATVMVARLYELRRWHASYTAGYRGMAVPASHLRTDQSAGWKIGLKRVEYSEFPSVVFGLVLVIPITHTIYRGTDTEQLTVVYAGLKAINQTKKSRVAFSPQSKTAKPSFVVTRLMMVPRGS
jgi:hypothetical protein